MYVYRKIEASRISVIRKKNRKKKEGSDYSEHKNIGIGGGKRQDH